MSSPEQSLRKNELLAELAQFTGDLGRYRHPLYRKLIYTPGVRHLAERAECYWLLDAVAAWVASREFTAAARRDPRIREIHFWRLVVNSDHTAVLTAIADSGEEPFIWQLIECTDFSLAEIDLYCAFDGELWTLMLPGEY
jgi:hypothetical protein